MIDISIEQIAIITEKLTSLKSFRLEEIIYKTIILHKASEVIKNNAINSPVYSTYSHIFKFLSDTVSCQIWLKITIPIRSKLSMITHTRELNV